LGFTPKADRLCSRLGGRSRGLGFAIMRGETHPPVKSGAPQLIRALVPAVGTPKRLADSRSYGTKVEQRLPPSQA
jgi:hypothetical protein